MPASYSAAVRRTGASADRLSQPREGHLVWQFVPSIHLGANQAILCSFTSGCKALKDIEKVSRTSS